ncbi:MAG: hypothetical protein HC869_05195 [Rhodospirillales bacterium]|nr:hypothetical protein [Rhodospirillales bacterium]
MSGVNGFWHFGLAGYEEAELRVIWSGGETGEWRTLKANAHYIISDNGASRSWNPSR